MGEPQKPHDLLAARLIALGKARNRKVRIYASKSKGERMRVAINTNAYLIFFPSTSAELTPGRIEQRIKNWPTIRNKPAAGYVILARFADLSQTTAATDGLQLPPRVAVVGLWGTKDRFVASDVDDGMALILSAANIPQGAIRRITKRNQPDELEQVPIQPEPADVENEALTNSEAQWGRFPRKGMFLDAYQLERRLGRGHSAEVWKSKLVRKLAGVDLSINSTVAIKIYSTALFQGFEALRIQREFSIAAELDHPNLAKVFDLVVSPSRPFHTFMVMEYIEGPTLKDYILQRGPISIRDTLKIARQLFAALSELHSLGAVHRDVKAANIMVASADQESVSVKLVDLGIVSIAAEERFTVASAFLGSKHSAPLEQLTGGVVDERADIYGAGSVLFHCLKGVPLYNGIGPEGAIVQQMMSKPEQLPIETNGNSVPNEFSNFVNKCIAVEASKRPRSAQECLELVNEFTRQLNYASDLISLRPNIGI
jgi:serine/threonine protein kinase